MARNWTIDFSEDAIADQIAQAKEAAIAEEKAGSCARKVEYDRQRDLIVFYFTNGSQFAVPPDLIQGLQEATVEQLKYVWLDRAGLSVHWPSLDADFNILGLVQGIFGTKDWMAEIGRQGGKQTSEAKRRSSRENGKKGGRPKSNRSGELRIEGDQESIRDHSGVIVRTKSGKPVTKEIKNKERKSETGFRDKRNEKQH